MEIKKEEKKGLNLFLKINIPSEPIEKEVEERLKEKGEEVTLPGFRKGKIPLNILRQKYGSQVMGEVVEDTLGEHIDKLVKDRDFKIAGRPKVEVDAYDEKKGLDISVKMDLLPELKLPKVDGIKLKRLNVKNPKSRLKDALEVLTRQQSQEAPLAKPRPAKLNDMAIIDFEGFVDGKAFEGGKGSDYHLQLGSNQFIEGFEDQIVGKKIGDSFDVNVTFPKEYHAPNLAGKKSTFKVKLKDLKEMKAAEINDAFAKDLGFGTVKELETAMSERLEEDAKQMTRRHLKRQLLTHLAGQLDEDVPESMLERELDAIWKEYNQAQQQDPSLEKKDEKSFKAEHANLAKRRILLGLALAEIGNNMDVKLDPIAVRQEITRYAQQYPGKEQQIFDAITKNPDVLMEFQAPLFEDKVVDAILEKANFDDKEVDMKDLLQEIDRLEEAALEALDDDKKSKSKKKAG